MELDEINKNAERLKAGNEDAFALLYAHFEKPLLNHIHKMVGTSEKSEEIFQETMLLMIKKINFYSPKKELANSFKAWLFRIATNLAIDEIRKNKRAQAGLLEEKYREQEPSIIITADEFDLPQIIDGLIHKLPTVQRTLLSLKVKEDLTYPEMAIICDCNINTVKQGLFRARKNLKSLLIKEGITL